MQTDTAGENANNKDGILPSMVKAMMNRVTQTQGSCEQFLQDANESIDQIELVLAGRR